MNLKFPDLDTLRLALTTGAIPASVSSAPCSFGTDAQEAIWVEAPGALPRAASTAVKKFGVQVARSGGAANMKQVACWAQLLPLQKDNEPLAKLEQTPVLFQMETGEQLARLAGEILRLGNDRQGYRWLEDDSAEGAPSRALLRVVEPPYYSLLRAIDRKEDPTAPVAFLERAKNVWVEIGWTHPLVGQVIPPEGQILLLRPLQEWILLRDEPFRDVYEVMEFTLTGTPTPFKDGRLADRLTVRPSLRPSGSTEAAELWVLRDDPVAELNQFVQDVDDQLLHRLAFAVGEREGQRVIILRVRQSKQPPPVLVMRATPYRPYLRIPNLFLPVGSRLHPPLRRDKVRQMLADDTSRIVWLTPVEDGSFVPESLPEDSFRPLWDWVDYILDHDREPLQAWMQAAEFDFEPFICGEEEDPHPKKPTTRDKGSRRGGKGSQDLNITSGPVFEFGNVQQGQAPEEEAELDDEEILEVVPVEPSELAIELRKLEEEFIGHEGGLDLEERVRAWPQLADLNGSLGNKEEAGICWSNAMWYQAQVPGEWAWRWFRVETSGIPSRTETAFPKGRNWTSHATLSGKKNREVTQADFDALLEMTEPASADLRALAAYIVWSARQAPPSPVLLANLGRAQRFLEKHEKLLPVRFAWLAWYHLVGLSGGDVLSLARARDRLLERLFQNGLRPEQDLPSFLRFAGQPTSQRFRAVRTWLTSLEELGEHWTATAPAVSSDKPNALTVPYVQLFFSFGLARLGETDAARVLLEQARDALRGNDVHQTLFQMFEYRIRQALEGKPHTGPLPTEQLEYVERGMDRMHRYVVDRMRQRSNILEPDQRIDPYRHWGARLSDLDRALADLVDTHDKQAIVNRVNELLKAVPRGAKGNDQRARILKHALDVAPRVGEEFAVELLNQTPQAYDALPSVTDPTGLVDRATFLEKGLTAAAHFDLSTSIHPLISRFRSLLESQRGERAIKALENLARQCFRGLRKLGMRDEIDDLLNLMADLVLEGRDLKDVENKLSSEAWRALLHVAGGWYYFGRDGQADRIVLAVRNVLFKETTEDIKEKTRLACGYATTVGQANVEFAQKRLEELFEKLKGVRDTYTTNAYYSISQLEVVEAVVLAIVSDDFTLGSQARRWLDDDEYLVRTRIHRDVRVMTGH